MTTGTDDKKPQSMMSDEMQFLKNKLDYHITRYRRKKNYSQVATSTCKILSLLIASSVTLLLGLKTSEPFKSYDNVMGASALILSAIATVVAGWEAFSDYSWRWVQYRISLSTLYNIRDDLERLRSQCCAPEKKDLEEIYNRMRSIIIQTSEEWMNKRAPSISGAKSRGEASAPNNSSR